MFKIKSNIFKITKMKNLKRLNWEGSNPYEENLSRLWPVLLFCVFENYFMIFFIVVLKNVSENTFKYFFHNFVKKKFKDDDKEIKLRKVKNTRRKKLSNENWWVLVSILTWLKNCWWLEKRAIDDLLINIRYLPSSFLGEQQWKSFFNCQSFFISEEIVRWFHELVRS